MIPLLTIEDGNPANNNLLKLSNRYTGETGVKYVQN